MSAATQSGTALCYIRLSVTKDGDVSNSPETQRANITAACEEKGYQPEFYEDVEGHKSGTKTENRPGWQALERRLADDDVVALVANDLARLHRRGWKIGQLIELLEKHHVALILAAPGRTLDTTTIESRLFIQVTAMFDEWYARDISLRTAEAIASKKKQGKTHARPPFGSIRGADGYLKPSPDGVWLLPDGTFVEGTAKKAPAPNAVWRGYHDAVEQIFKFYTTEGTGYTSLASRINAEGYMALSQQYKPVMFGDHTIKRILRAWPEYGGTVMEVAAKERSAKRLQGIDVEKYLSPERAIFDVDLLRKVGETFLNRTSKNAGTGKKKTAHTYALQGILVCHHCAEKADRENDPTLRTKLESRQRNNSIRYYQHKPNINCGCKPKSVPCDALEIEFGELLKRIKVRPEIMAAVLLQSSATSSNHDSDDSEFIKEKNQAITLAKRRFEHSKRLYREGELEDSDYDADKARYESTLAEWEERSRALQKVVVTAQRYLPVLDNLSRLWDVAGNEDRYELARYFEEVVVNLSTGKIESFKLKDWVDALLFEQVEDTEDTETPPTEA